MACTSILPIGPPSDRFSHTLHEPTHIAEPTPKLRSLLRRADHHLQLMRLRFSGGAILIPPLREDVPPSASGFEIRPSFHDIWAISQDHMEVIVHDTEREHINPERSSEEFEPITNPLTSMFVISP
jgi:hypothetical protein